MADMSGPARRSVVPVAHYSSATERPERRYEVWREGSLLSSGQLYDTTPLEPFATDTIATQLDVIGFSRSRMTSQIWRRTSKLIRADDVDPLMIAIRLEGGGRGDADGRDFVVPAGGIVMSDLARPNAYLAETADTAVLAIPRTVAERVLPPVRDLHGFVIQPAAAAPLVAHARALTRAVEGGLPVRQAAALGTIALDLLEVGVAQAMGIGRVSPAAVATGIRLAAEAAIERHLASAALTIDNLIRWTGASRSTLYRSFDRDGGIRAFVQRRRLDRVATELQQGWGEPLAVIAERWGFRDVSHMSRAFRRTFGQSPGDYRAWHRLLREEQVGG